MRKGVYGTNLEAVWSLQSEVRKDHIQYHEDLDETRTTRKEYNRSQQRAVAQFKEVTKRDDRQKNSITGIHSVFFLSSTASS